MIGRKAKALYHDTMLIRATFAPAMRSTALLHALTALAVAAATVLALHPASAGAQSIGNRHHLDPCALQSAPVVIPHADVRTVDIGLPAEVGGGYDVLAVTGGEESYRERFSSRSRTVGPRRHRPPTSSTVTRGRASGSSGFGGVVLAPRSEHPCHR